MQNYALKIVLVGDSRVGKSQLARSFLCKNILVSQPRFLLSCTVFPFFFVNTISNTHLMHAIKQYIIAGGLPSYCRN